LLKEESCADVMFCRLLQYAVLILPMISDTGANACNGEEDHCSVQDQKRLLHTRGHLGSTQASDGMQRQTQQTATGDWMTCIYVTSNRSADCASEAQQLNGEANARAAGGYVVNNEAICTYEGGQLQMKNGQPPSPCMPNMKSAPAGYSCYTCYHYTNNEDQKPPPDPNAPPTPAPTPEPTPAPTPEPPPTIAPYPAYQPTNFLLAAKSRYIVCTFNSGTTANTNIVVYSALAPGGQQGSTTQFYWNQNPMDYTIRFKPNPSLCLNAQNGMAPGNPIILFPCSPLTNNAQWVAWSDGSIRFKDMTNVGFNVQFGLANNNKLQTFTMSSPPASNEQFWMGSIPPVSANDETAPAVIIKSLYLCQNRGSLGGKGCCSTSQSTLKGCADWVASNAGCGTQFSWSWAQGWCDCVAAAQGECVPYTDAGTQEGNYNLYALAPYFYMKWHLAVCLNRGGAGGNPAEYSVNLPNLQACAAHVKGNPSCGSQFSYGSVDHWCDCVPAGKGPCTYYTNADTQSQKYSVYTIP